MRRALVLLVVAAACKKTPPPPATTVEEPKPGVIDAAIDVAPVALPAADKPIEGNLAGKPFKVAKAMLRTRPNGASLHLYAWSEGGPCEPQFAPEPDHLYVDVSFPADRLVTGTPITSDVRGVSAVYKKPDLGPIAESATLVFDEIGRDKAKARLSLTAPDGTRVAGRFEATVCASPQQTLAEPAPIHGMKWGTREVDPKSIPNQPVTGVLLGDVGAPVAVEVVDWKDVAEQHEVHFYFTPPKQPCQFDQLTPGFKVGFGETIKRGVAVKVGSWHENRGGRFAAVIWQEPGKGLGEVGQGWVSAIIDKATRDTVEGRVFAWFDDPSKSMIAGAFTAKNCNIKP